MDPSPPTWSFPPDQPAHDPPSPPHPPPSPPTPASPAAAAATARARLRQQEERESAKAALQNAAGDAPAELGLGGKIKRKLRTKMGDKDMREKGKAAPERPGSKCARSEVAGGMESAAGSGKSAASIRSVLKGKLEDRAAELGREVDFGAGREGGEGGWEAEMSGGLGGDGEGGGDVRGEGEAGCVKDVERRERRGRRHRRRGRRHSRRERRREREGETSESDSGMSSDVRYHVSYGPAGAWGCVVM